MNTFLKPYNRILSFRRTASLNGVHYLSLAETANRLYMLIRWVLAGVFLYSGITKLMDPGQFAEIIQAYGLISAELSLPAAMGLSIVEVLAGTGLLLDLRWSLSVITGLLVFFMIILGYGLHLGLDVDCGCFGADDPEGKAFHSLWPAMYRDGLMLFGAGYLYLWRHKTGWCPGNMRTLIKNGRGIFSQVKKSGNEG